MNSQKEGRAALPNTRIVRAELFWLSGSQVGHGEGECDGNYVSPTSNVGTASIKRAGKVVLLELDVLRYGR